MLPFKAVHAFCMICFVAPLAGPHTTTKSTDLAGFHIPKDTVILTNYYSVHLDETQWKDPLRFNPERFLTSEGTLATKTPAQFMPFGIGELMHFMHFILYYRALCMYTAMMSDYRSS